MDFVNIRKLRGMFVAERNEVDAVVNQGGHGVSHGHVLAPAQYGS